MKVEEIRDVFCKLEGLKKLKNEASIGMLLQLESKKEKGARDNFIALISMMQSQIIQKLERIYINNQDYDMTLEMGVRWSRNFEFSILENRGYVDSEKGKEYQEYIEICQNTGKLCESLGIKYQWEDVDLLENKEENRGQLSRKVTQSLIISSLLCDSLVNATNDEKKDCFVKKLTK